MKQRDRTSILAALGMIVLILDAKTALSGAREGIDLCMRTVIPALFPFFICILLSFLSLQQIQLSRSLQIGSLPKYFLSLNTCFPGLHIFRIQDAHITEMLPYLTLTCIISELYRVTPI